MRILLILVEILKRRGNVKDMGGVYPYSRFIRQLSNWVNFWGIRSPEKLMNPASSRSHHKDEGLFDLSPPQEVGWVTINCYDRFRETGIAGFRAGKEK